MLTQEEIDRIIREDLDKGKVDATFLSDNNISLESALEMKLLKANDDGTYSVIDFVNFNRFALHNRKIKEFRYALLAYKKCYELRPNDLYAIENYFFRLLREKEYNEAYEIFLKMLSLGTYNYKTEENLFKLLFSRIINLPEEDLAYVRLLQCDDCMVPEDDTRFPNVVLMNEARKLIYLGNEKMAVRMLMDYAKELDAVPAALNAIVDLANAAFHEYIVLQVNVTSYVEKGDYESALALYLEREKKTTAKVKDDVVKHLLETLIKIKNGEEVLNNDVFTIDNAFTLALHNNFVKAREYNNQREYDGRKNKLITMLLDKVCSSLTKPEDASVSIEDIEEAIILDDYRNVFHLVNVYLQKHNRIDFYPYAALICAYDRLNTTDYMLDFLKSENPQFDAEVITLAFDRDFAVKNFANCLLYYYMLEFLLNNKLANGIDLEYYGEKMSHKKKGIYGDAEVLLYDTQCCSDVRMSTIPYNKSITKYSGPNGKYEKIFDRVKDKRVLEIFETADHEEYLKVLELAEADDNIIVSTIKGLNGYIMFVKYVKDKTIDESVDNIILADEAYVNKNYKGALKFYLRAMCYTKSFSIELITKVALCYMELDENEKAGKYLEIASILCQIRGLEDYFAEYVMLLQTNAEVAPAMYSMVERLEYTVVFDAPYEEIARLIVEEGLSFEEATGKYDLSAETIWELKLYYAEFAYILGNGQMAEGLIEEVVNNASDYYKGRALELYNNRDKMSDTIDVTPIVRKYILG